MFQSGRVGPTSNARTTGATPASPDFEVRGEWSLRRFPRHPQPWMALGRVYVIVLRRASPGSLPEAEVRDRDTDEPLATYRWRVARQLFCRD